MRTAQRDFNSTDQTRYNTTSDGANSMDQLYGCGA